MGKIETSPSCTFDTLDDDNFLYYCATKYYNPRSNDSDDFYEDLRRVKYIKRLVSEYKNTGYLSIRLLTNHLIILGNTFTPEGAMRILEHKLSDDSMGVLKPILTHIRYLEYRGWPDVESDPKVFEFIGERL